MVTKCQGDIFFSYPITETETHNILFYFLLKVAISFFWFTFIQKTETFYKSRHNARVHFSNSYILLWPCTSMTISTQDLWLPLSTNVTKHNWSISKHFLPKFSAYTLPFRPLSAKPLLSTVKACLLAQLLHLFTLSILVFDLLFVSWNQSVALTILRICNDVCDILSNILSVLSCKIFKILFSVFLKQVFFSLYLLSLTSIIFSNINN